MDTTTGTLTVRDLTVLGMIADACQSNAHVRWLHGDDILSGTARAFTSADGHSLGDTDVRDGYVRVSATFEHFLPVRDVMRMVQDGEFAIERAS